MQKISLDALARQQIAAAVAAPSGRAADTAFGGHEEDVPPDRDGVPAGTQLSEHQNPGEATVFVLAAVCGFVRQRSWQGKTGDLLIVPDGLAQPGSGRGLGDPDDRREDQDLDGWAAAGETGRVDRSGDRSVRSARLDTARS